MWQRPNWIRVSSICRGFLFQLFFSIHSNIITNIGCARARSVQTLKPRCKTMLDGFRYCRNWSARNSPIEPIQWIIQAIAYIFRLRPRKKSICERKKNPPPKHCLQFELRHTNSNLPCETMARRKKFRSALWHSIRTVLNSISLYILSYAIQKKHYRKI